MEPDVPSAEIVHFTEYGSGSPLLLVHGLMVSGDMFEPVIAQFAIHYRVIVPDLRGHGQSRALGGPYTAERLALDLVSLLDHLDIKTTDVLGYSQGGAIAQQLAFDHPERCHHLVLICTYARNMFTVRERLEGRLFPFLMHLFGITRMARIAVSFGAQHLSKERADWLTGIMSGQDQDLMICAWREAMAFDGRQHLAKIKSPTLIISGSRDSAVPLHHANMLRDGISDSQLVIVDGADHALIWTNPDKLVYLTKAFLQS